MFKSEEVMKYVKKSGFFDLVENPTYADVEKFFVGEILADFMGITWEEELPNGATLADVKVWAGHMVREQNWKKSHGGNRVAQAPRWIGAVDAGVASAQAEDRFFRTVAKSK